MRKVARMIGVTGWVMEGVLGSVAGKALASCHGDVDCDPRVEKAFSLHVQDVACCWSLNMLGGHVANGLGHM